MFRICVLIAVLGCCGQCLSAEPVDDHERYRITYRFLADVMPKYSLAKVKLDDELSKRVFELAINTFDSRRLYFTQGDIDRLSKYQVALDDHSVNGDLAFPLELKPRYLFRLAQVTKWANEFLHAEHDFSVDETYALSPKQFCESEDALKDRWRKRIKYELLVLRADGLSDELAKTVLRKRFTRVAATKLQEEEFFFEYYFSAFTRGFSPHDSYMCASTLNWYRD